MSTGTLCVLGLGTAAVTLTMSGLHAGGTADSGAASPLVVRFLSDPGPPLVSYRAIRHLAASARGGKMTASLTAVTEFDRGALAYSILEETGSGMIRSKVLRRALEAERAALASGDGASAALTPANYRFGADEAADGLVRVGIRPLREHAMLLDGAIFLVPDSGDLVRVEGRLVKRPSFWTRRVDIVRRYTRLAGVRVPVVMESTARVLVAGTATFEMRYEYESVNGMPVSGPTSGP